MSAPALPRRGRYAFLRTPRWLGLTAVMLVVCAACVLLGMWQWDRYATRTAEVDQVTSAYDTDPVPAAQLLDGRPVVTPDVEWRPVELVGRYVDGATVLLRNRPVSGNPAVHVVTPFVAELGGRQVLVVVDRGWLPADAGLEEVPDVPAPPDGEVTVVGRLRDAEAPFDRDPPPGQVYTLDPGQVLAGAATRTDVSDVSGLPALSGYVQLAGAEQPGGSVPRDLPPPATDLGPHLSYAVQWWIFAAGALVGLVVLARREAQDADELGEPPVRRRSAEDEEDALVDAQLRGEA